MSDDVTTREDQAVIERLTQGAMQQLAAGRAAEEVSSDLQATGLAKSTCDALVEHLQQRWREIAAAPQANAEAYFRTKYPEMRPVRSAPWLFNVHGLGAGLYNERDRDPVTGTFVKTHCLCVIFVPILALGAYRVYPRGSGWTLIGKVPLSRFAFWWNVLFLLGIAAWIGLAVWFDEDNAERSLERGDEVGRGGKLAGSRAAVRRRQPRSQPARRRVQAVCRTGPTAGTPSHADAGSSANLQPSIGHAAEPRSEVGRAGPRREDPERARQGRPGRGETSDAVPGDHAAGQLRGENKTTPALWPGSKEVKG